MAITKLNPVAINKRIARFTANGTWTVPAGVTYAVAHIRGAGGGIGSGSPGNGGNSSVAFAGGTITANGGGGVTTFHNANPSSAAGPTNSGLGAKAAFTAPGASEAGFLAQDGAFIIAADTVTPVASITVTVGAGGTAGTSGAAGGTGYVFIEYYE